MLFSRLPQYRGTGTINTNVSAEFAGLAHHSLFLRCLLKLTTASLSKDRYNFVFKFKPTGKHNTFILDDKNPASMCKIKLYYQEVIAGQSC
jgi:hypothetical protein